MKSTSCFKKIKQHFCFRFNVTLHWLANTCLEFVEPVEFCKKKLVGSYLTILLCKVLE